MTPLQIEAERLQAIYAAKRAEAHKRNAAAYRAQVERAALAALAEKEPAE